MNIKKLVSTLITISMLSAPSVTLFAGHGDAAAGVAAGLIGGAMITGIASQSGRRAREEAREAKREVEDIRREQQKDKITDIQRQIEKQQIMHHSSRTVNLLILAIAILFLCLIGLSIIVIRKKQ